MSQGVPPSCKSKYWRGFGQGDLKTTDPPSNKFVPDMTDATERVPPHGGPRSVVAVHDWSPATISWWAYLFHCLNRQNTGNNRSGNNASLVLQKSQNFIHQGGARLTCQVGLRRRTNTKSRVYGDFADFDDHFLDADRSPQPRRGAKLKTCDTIPAAF